MHSGGLEVVVVLLSFLDGDGGRAVEGQVGGRGHFFAALAAVSRTGHDAAPQDGDRGLPHALLGAVHGLLKALQLGLWLLQSNCISHFCLVEFLSLSLFLSFFLSIQD